MDSIPGSRVQNGLAARVRRIAERYPHLSSRWVMEKLAAEVGPLDASQLAAAEESFGEVRAAQLRSRNRRRGLIVLIVGIGCAIGSWALFQSSFSVDEFGQSPMERYGTIAYVFTWLFFKSKWLLAVLSLLSLIKGLQLLITGR